MTANLMWQLREWLTINDAAEALTESLGGQRFTAADILSLALDGHLKLSVNLQETPAACYERNKGDGPTRRAHINGLWELSLVGPGRRQIEHEYHRQRGLPFITMEGSPGAFVERDGLICRVPPDPGATGFSPRGASALPPEAVIVVRTTALDEVRQTLMRIKLDAAREAWGYSVAKTSPQDQADAATAPSGAQEDIVEKPVATRERATLLTIIAALAKAANIDISKPSKAAGSIEALTNELGARVSARRIEDHLKAIPDAIERRSKSS